MKKSDLKSIFGAVTQYKPIYVHINAERDQRVAGTGSDKLKFRTLICAQCNNQRTQPFDKTWQRLSEYLRSGNSPLHTGALMFHLDRVFPTKTQSEMLAVHLYFLKLFGCLIAENSIPLNASEFANAILKNEPHPKVHIGFYKVPKDSKDKLIHRSPVSSFVLNGKIVYAAWFYMIDRLAVNIIYAEPTERREGLIRAWHPSSKRRRVQLSKLPS